MLPELIGVLGRNSLMFCEVFGVLLVGGPGTVTGCGGCGLTDRSLKRSRRLEWRAAKCHWLTGGETCPVKENRLLQKSIARSVLRLAAGSCSAEHWVSPQHAERYRRPRDGN